jgi:xanthine/CO dehydrogenase XdhC/CoxF family maturation factor
LLENHAGQIDIEFLGRHRGAQTLGRFVPSYNRPVTEDLQILEQARRWREAGKRVALATVLATWGSSPRPAGSQLAVEEAGAMAGSVSGGCVEAAVIEAALEVMASGRGRRLAFGVADETAWAVGLSCGGRIEIWVESIE